MVKKIISYCLPFLDLRFQKPNKIEKIKFSLTIDEQREFKKWEETHCCGNEPDWIGGKYTFSFHPTNLGTACSVKCMCGEEKWLTDFSEF